MVFQPALDKQLVRVELAAAKRPARLAILVLEPMADRVPVQIELPRDLAHPQLLFLAQSTNLAISGISNHD